MSLTVSRPGEGTEWRGGVVPAPARGRELRPPVRVGIVNNMPDAAMINSERQLESLLAAAAGDVPVVVRYYSLPEVARDEEAAAYCEGAYHEVRELFQSPADALIVTGAEPRASELQGEPFWTALAEMLEWADRHLSSTICSCLAAHAALLRFSGVRRRRLPTKRCGVFEHAARTTHPLTRGLPAQTLVPHSRWNDVLASDLSEKGYTSLIHSREVGAHLLVKQGASLRVLMQGHPEYETLTLLREYRRDVGRYLNRASDEYPELPEGYLDQCSMEKLRSYRRGVERRRPVSALTDFPFEFVATRTVNTWRKAGMRVMANWLGFVESSR